MACCMDRPSASGGQPAAGRDLCRQPWHRPPRHIAPLGGDHRADGRTHRGRRRGDQPVLHRVDLGLKVFDLALDLPTADITEEAALDERNCAATMAFGMEAVAGDIDLLCIGDLGVGNTTVAAALFAALLGGNGAEWVGSGSGADDTMMGRKAEVVDRALALHGNHLKDPLEALRRVGGREFAAIAGAILAARMQKVPVVLDGFATTAAAAVLHAANPSALDHCVLAHLSVEPGHARAAEKLGLRPILDLQLASRRGDGSRACRGHRQGGGTFVVRNGCGGQVASLRRALRAAALVGIAGSASMTRDGGKIAIASVPSRSLE